MSKLNYKTSKDYKRLKELLDKGEGVIVLWKDCIQRTIPFQRAFPAFKEFDKEGWCQDGYYYVGAFSWREGTTRTFDGLCKEYDVEFIEPNGEE